MIGVGNFTDSIEKVNSLLKEPYFPYVADLKSSESQSKKQTSVFHEESKETKYFDGTNQHLKLDCSKDICTGSPEAIVSHINRYISVKSPINNSDRKKLITRWLVKYDEVSEEDFVKPLPERKEKKQPLP